MCPVRERHYAPVAGLNPRTEGDLTAEFVTTRASVTTFTRVDRAKPKAPSLISSSEGSMDRLLLTVPTYAARGLASTYQDLFSMLPQTTLIVVLVHEATKSIVEGWITAAGLEQRATVVVAPDHLYFSVWAEDGYVIAKDTSSGETYFVEPFSFPRYGDSLVADFISNATDLKDTQSPVYFQGGNVLIGDDFFMIGADYPANSLDYIRSHLQPDPGEQPAELIRRLYKEYLDSSRELIYVGSSIPVPKHEERWVTVNGQQWKEIVYFGNKEGTSQPLFHIDMFISFAGRADNGAFRLLVGDPSSAANILGTPIFPHAMQQIFDNIAQFLTARNFEVIRNPLPLVYIDDPIKRLRTWYFATSNNLLVQNDDGAGKAVWLPSYGYGGLVGVECHR